MRIGTLSAAGKGADIRAAGRLWANVGVRRKLPLIFTTFRLQSLHGRARNEPIGQAGVANGILVANHGQFSTT
jgi:hypothetical protein